ncbi:MAG TPA: (d)CMP kinase [Devosiaceae bacterium]|nr:(d)CMP kinase [Devosiaceae bacterium]
MIIAVDGPAASGKGTLAAGLAQHFNLPQLDTGLLYRAVGLAVAEAAETADFEPRAIAAAEALDPTHLDPDRLGTAEAALLAARVARIPEVRAALREFQRQFAAQPGGAVIDGRDIGTRICPDADVKLFITAETGVRADRRTAQLQGRGIEIDRDEIFRQIAARDESDRSNPAGAFYPAADAHLLDTSKLDIDAALRAAIDLVEAAMASKAG